MLNKSLRTGAAALLLVIAPFVAAQSADEIMQKNDKRYTGDTQKSTSVLTLIDKKGNQRVRDLLLYSIDKKDVKKSLFFFQSPAEVKGTGYLSFDWDDPNKEDDSWLYLPALQKITRVAASDESGSFMGSDFSYADINGTDYEDYHYTIVKDSDPVDGADCWVIHSTPKDDSIVEKTGYLDATNWIRKDNYMQVKSIINVKKGKRIKYFQARDIKQIQGIWTALSLQMVTTQNGKKEHASVFTITDVKYNDALDDSLFDTQTLQRGLQ